MTEGHGGWEPEQSWSDPTQPADGMPEHGMAGEGALADGGLTGDDGLDDDGGLAGDAGTGDPDMSDPDQPMDFLDDGVDGAGAPAVADHPEPEPADLGDDADPAEATVDGAELAGPAQSVDAAPFPPALDLDVTPSDGQPWVNPELLGPDPGSAADVADPATPPTDPTAALLADLHLADGGDGQPSVSTLTLSDDPAIRALAAYWS